MKRVGLFGLNLLSENLGCQALAKAFLIKLSKEISHKLNVYIFILWPRDKHIPATNIELPNLNIEFIRIDFRNRSNRKKMTNTIKRTNLCIDFTEGDSFTDMYGLRRFFLQAMLKTYVIINKIPLILGPQTYGPFKSIFSKVWTKKILNKAQIVFSRDQESIDTIKQLTNRDCIITTDIAMLLPVKSVPFTIPVKGINIGINVSGLLFNGGYTGNNQFKLSVNYNEYILGLLDNLTANEENNIFLIPHVITDSNPESQENDLKVIQGLHYRYKSTIIVDKYKTAEEIKFIISKMDVFTGARMHATIAAFSSRVPTIPFSYSKKFEGLYGTLNYPYCIDGRKLSTNDAITTTLRFIENKDSIREKLNDSYSKAEALLRCFESEIISWNNIL